MFEKAPKRLKGAPNFFLLSISNKGGWIELWFSFYKILSQLLFDIDLKGYVSQSQS